MGRLMFLLFFLALTVSSYAGIPMSSVTGVGKFKPLTDITCPSIPPPNTCTAVCPSGWKPDPTGTYSDPMKTGGVYACFPAGVDSINELYKACFYYAPCPVEPIAKKVDEIVAGAYGNELKEFFSKNTTLMDKIIAVATLTYPQDKSADLPPILNFFYSLINKYYDSLFKMFIFYFFPALMWTSALFGLSSLLERKIVINESWTHELASYVGQKFPDVKFHKILWLKMATAVGLFLIPVPTYSIQGKAVYTPAVVGLISYYLHAGNYVADKFAQEGVKSFISYTLQTALESYKYENTANEVAVYEAERKALGAENTLKACWAAFGKGTNFIVPDDELANIPIRNPYFYNKYGLSRKFCRDAEVEYKRAVMSYNVALARYRNSSQIARFLENHGVLQDIVEEAKNIKDLDIYTGKIFTTTDPKRKIVVSNAIVVATVQKLGWFSFPMVAFPTASLIYSEVETSKDLDKMLGTGGDTDPSWFAELLAIVSFPPGNWIFSSLKDLALESSKAFAQILAPLFGKFGLDKVFAGIGSLGALGVALAATYFMTKALLTMLPTLFIAIVFAIRILLWIAEIIKTVVLTPFVSLHFLIPNSGGRPWGFVRRALALGVQPVILLGGAIVAFIVAILTDYIFYKPAVYVMNMLGKVGYFDVIKGLPVWFDPAQVMSAGKYQISAGGWFIKTFIVAILFYLNELLKIYLVYKFLVNLPEQTLKMLKFDEESSTMVSHQVAEISEIIKKAGSPV